MPTVIATPGAANANSYITVDEFQDYLETAYEVTEDPNALDEDALVIMATRLMESFYSPSRKLYKENGEFYYLVRPTWTGAVATATQRLLWPRTGMLTRTGQPIASNVIPQELKDATAELARQLKKGDTTIDNSTAVQGITAVRAGSVSVSFKDSGIETLKAIPDIVFQLLVPSWLTDEIYESANLAEFNVVSE